MDVKQYDFHLPEELIAQTPLKERTKSRLMKVDRKTGAYEHTEFSTIIDELNPGDVLVLNNTKVLPARLHGVKSDTGAHIELLLLKEIQTDEWEALVKPAKRVKVGTIVTFGEGQLQAVCTHITPEGARHFKMSYEGIFYEVLETLGEMPLPPYITEKLEDADRYQTVFAKERGSAAAPTAGLHFTTALLQAIEAKGIAIAYVTLHVGLGTFRPVSVDSIEDHKMHEEYYALDEQNAAIITNAQKRGGRIVAVGTTSIRTLESIAQKHDGNIQADAGWTSIFIYPGYTFLAVDALITNFHLPQSTLLMLVSALSSREIMMKAYQEAVSQKYRFFSFGDAMFIRNKEENQS